MQQRRNEDLATDRFAGDARREDDVLAVEVVSVVDRLAGVQANAHLHVLAVRRVVSVERALDRDRAVETLLR